MGSEMCIRDSAWEVEAINDRWRHRVYRDPYLNPNWADHRAQLIEPTNW